MKTKSIDEFIEGIAAHYPPHTEIDGDLNQLNKTIFNNNECVFVWDIRSGEMIFKRGFYNLLGYSDIDMNLEIFVGLFHPEDQEYIIRLGQAAVHHSIKNPVRNSELCLYVSHRIKTLDDRFIKILAQSSPHKIDNEGLIASFLVKLSDISFVDTSDAVQYKFLAHDLDPKTYHDLVFENNKTIFTPREVEVIVEIAKGLSNSQIAVSLNISKYTVETHRKKILKKSNCHSAEELIAFSRANGILK